MSGDFSKENGTTFIENPMLCDETSHEEEELRYFCKEESCRRCICQQCTTSYHEQHQVQSLEEASKNTKEILEQDVNRAQQLREKYEQELEQSKKDMERIEREIEVAKKEVDDTVEMIRKMAIEHGRAMKHQLDQTLQEQKTASDDEQTDINTGIKRMSEIFHQLQTLKDMQVSNEVTNSKKLFQERRELLSQTPQVCNKPVVSSVTVHYETNKQVIQSLEDIGKIVKSVTDSSQSNIELKMTRNAERELCPTGVGEGNEARKDVCGEEPTNNSPLFNPVKTFGEYGFGEGQLNGPRSVAVSSAGELAVAECDNHRIQIFSPIEGKCLREFGGKGEGEGQLLWPCGVVFNEDRIIVTDGRDGKGRIQEFFLNGSYVRTIYRPQQWFAPRGMCVNDDKNIAVCCWGNEELGIKPSIRVFSKQGLMEEFCMLDYDEQPWYITYGNGKYFVSCYDQNYVSVLDENGVLLYKFGGQGLKGGQFIGVRGLAVYGPDRILVCDFDNHRVQLLTQEGQFLNSFGSYGSGDGQMDSPTDLVVTSDGGVFVSEWFNQRIQLWSYEL